MKRLFSALVVCTALTMSQQAARSDDSRLTSGQDFAFADIRLSDEPSASSNAEPAKRTMSSVSRLRQERALYQQSQRIARMEANAWMGYEPLRPTWNAVPMMASRYPINRTIVIPVFVP